LGAGSADAGEHRRKAVEVTIETRNDIDWTELAEREHDGITVTLYWARSTNVLAVTVDDVSTGDYFELVLADNEPPLDVFYHPFAYARRRGVELLADRHEAEVAVDAVDS
jgi:hypothetical protein